MVYTVFNYAKHSITAVLCMCLCVCAAYGQPISLIITAEYNVWDAFIGNRK